MFQIQEDLQKVILTVRDKQLKVIAEWELSHSVFEETVGEQKNGVFRDNEKKNQKQVQPIYPKKKERKEKDDGLCGGTTCQEEDKA